MVAELVGDPRFFIRSGPYSLAEVAACCHAELSGADRQLSGVAPLQTAGPGDVSFLDNRRYAPLLAETRAGAVIVHPALAQETRTEWAALLHRQPYLAWARVCALFHPTASLCPGRHPTSFVDPSEQVDASVEVGPFASIGAGATIGAGCRIGPHVSIGDGVVLGAACSVGAGASVSHAVIGTRVKLYPGVRLGQDGFGFAPDEAGAYVTVPQLGRVIVQDDVEIGANSTIARGSMHDTVIGAGSRLDNLVQIAHNVRLGKGCVIVSQVGISGSTTLGDHVMVAGQAGLIGHLTIGSKARIGAQAGVMADVAPGASVIGSPCQPSRQFFRDVVVLRRLAEEEAARAIAAGRSKRQADAAGHEG